MIISSASGLRLTAAVAASSSAARSAHSLSFLTCAELKSSASLPGFPSPFVAPAQGSFKRGRRNSCNVAIGSDSETSTLASGSTSTSSLYSSEEEKEASAVAKIGARIRVKVPLKVYHVPKVPEVDITGMEGEIKSYVGLWKGKRISANFPFKVEFFTQVEGRGPVKFFAHLREDEFDYL